MAKGTSRRDAEEALFNAQELVFEAYEQSSKAKQIALAKKALAISPLCADAHSLLASFSEAGSDEELNHLKAALAAGEAAIGNAGFKEMAGHFWGFIETRPYMRARHGLANALWQRGRHDEALAHFNEMLKLNPDDNQGIRHVLAARLCEQGRDKELAKLLKRYKEDSSAAWLWTFAWAEFRSGGDCEASRKRLTAAVEQNKHVLSLLAGTKKMPKSLPAFMGFGDAAEAQYYNSEFGGAWRNTLGAIEWAAGFKNR